MEDPAFAQERARHAAVLEHQRRYIILLKVAVRAICTVKLLEGCSITEP